MALGLMVTSALIYWVLHFLSFTVQIRNVCVLTAPLFSSFASMATYLLTSEAYESKGAGLIAAATFSIVPGYISRSVAGSFDNEGVAIFAMIFTFYLWVKAVKTGSMYWATLTSFAYFYMVAAWGGYVFVLNLIALHTVVLMFTGRYSQNVYVAYSTFYVLGTILAMQIRFVGFQAIQSSEHLASLGTFGLLQLVAFGYYLNSTTDQKSFRKVVKVILVGGISSVIALLFLGQLGGFIAPWTGRFYSFLDPSHAKAHIPIIASVSEHQPTSWASYFFDLHILILLIPAGIYFCLKNISDTSIFIVLYGVTSVYFSGVMVRLMLVLAPIASVLAGISISEILTTYFGFIHEKPSKQKTSTSDANKMIAYIIVCGTAVLLVFYAMHCTWVTSQAYSSPSVVLASYRPDGSRVIFDDFRDAYWWINMNTPPDAKIMSWWDYGYQIAAMGNRTTIVDNNTWNNSHIAEVGTAFASEEEDAIKIIRQLDVDYVLVVFGGLTGYSSDDINKFLWMVRIGGSTHPEIVENDYFNAQHEYRVDSKGSPKLLNCLMYKLCFYRFGETYTQGGRPSGYDRVRNAEIGNKNFQLKYFDEVFSSQRWIVRIYKVKDLDNRS